MVYCNKTKTFDKLHYKNLIKYISQFQDSLNCNIWFDHTHKSYFSAAQTIETPHSGKHHSFIMNRSKFLSGNFSGPPNLVNMGRSYEFIKSSFPECATVQTPELRCGFNKFIEEIRNQESVFIVGGGPSTLSVNFDDYENIPKWTMNNFYNNEIFSNLSNIQAITLLDDVDITSSSLWDFIDNKKPIILQEFSDPRFGNSRIKFLRSKYDKIAHFMTRYRSRIGIGARLLVLSILLGTKNIYISGLDGYTTSDSKTHAFEENKQIPGWLQQSGPYLQKQQFVIFWDYVLNELSKTFDFKIHDISKDCETVQYSFMKEYIK